MGDRNVHDRATDGGCNFECIRAIGWSRWDAVLTLGTHAGGVAEYPRDDPRKRGLRSGSGQIFCFAKTRLAQGIGTSLIALDVTLFVCHHASS